MTGIENFNRTAFDEAEALLKKQGYRVVNPAKVKPIGGTEWENYMRGDIRELCSCDTIALLPGWQDSKGAQLEVHVAHRLGIKIMALPSCIEF